MATLLKGAPVAAMLTGEAKARAAALTAQGIIPTLAIVTLGQRDDDAAYRRGALKRCDAAGVRAVCCDLSEETSQKELLRLIDALNRDESVHGVLIMRPLPGHIDDAAVVSALSPEKDVDGVTPVSMAALYSGSGECFAPCTAQSCLELLKFYRIPLEGRTAAVIGRSLVIGKPVSQLLLRENMTVTTCHSRSQELAQICRGADLIIAAAGRAGIVTADFAAEGQTVIDVGIHQSPDGGLCGDVKTDEVSEIVHAVTPVPGGVGAVTTSVLVSHVVAAAERAAKKSQKEILP